VATERRRVPQTDRRALGARVEALAGDFLRDEGLVAIALNAQFRDGELDLVMRDGDSLVFVEVRYRRNGATQGFGGGAASIDAGKRRRIVQAAERFLAAHRDLSRLPCRFDVIDASGDPDAPRFTWLRDAFRADDV
jgi:putative endonuclease